LKASLDLLNLYGAARIARHLEELTDYLCERVREKPYEIVSSRVVAEKSQIVCIRHTHGLSAMALYARLKQENIITAPRGDRLRIAPHLYNSLDDINQLLEVLP
jgi:selenocysteine lyase/cysteine desulfurase